MWEKLKNRKLRFIPRRSNTRVFRGEFVDAKMRYSDVAVVEFSGAFEGDNGPYSQSFYIHLDHGKARKGLMPGLVLVEVRGRKGAAPDLEIGKPYLASDGDWVSILDDATGEELIGRKK
jgi:hypothetical protein